MEWLLTNTQIHSTFASLGSVQGENYVTSGDCLEILEEINYKLEAEDHTLRSFRRAIGFGQNVRNDIIPLLVNVKDQKIIEATIRILVNLTIPVECLMPVDSMLASDMGRHTVFELNKLLIHVKESFTDSKTTKSVLEYMKVLLDSDTKLGTKSCGEINNCLLLLRNILNIPEHLHKNYFNLPRTSMQNQIVWNLFTQSVDRILLQVMTCPERSHWCVTLVQLIALMYKDQHVNTLQKLLNICFEASISDSSEDNESNTSPVKESNSDSSPMVTSDPTSDSSDNGGTGNKRQCDERRNLEVPRNETSSPCKNTRKGESPIPAKEGEIRDDVYPDVQEGTSFALPPEPQMTSSGSGTANNGNKSSGMKFRNKLSPTSELSDCGYGTQVENPESISTSSTEDYTKPPVHQKPPATNQKQRMNSVNKPRKVLTTIEKTEWRRKKLVKRSRSTMINMKGLINHTPTDDDITNILKEFTVDFLLKGYGLLVEDLHEQLMTDVHLKIDTSHFFWLVTYFLKFAAQLELDLGHVHSIFTFDIIGYSMFEAVSICEQLDLVGFDLVPSLRRLHLSVTAIREFLQAIETYKKISHLRKEDLRYLGQLEYQIASSKDLRSLFILLLRRFNPSIQSKQYLQDVIVTNHHLLMLLDQVSRRSESALNVSVNDHIKQFASVDIMHCYGYLLEDFNENGEFVNDCIFTMMHHVAGDVGQVSVLFQPNILKAFSKIWDTEFELCDDWSDLVEYVINKFISNPKSSHHGIPPTNPILEFPTNIADLSWMDQKPQTLEWSVEELDALNWYYAQARSNENPIEVIACQLKDNGHVKRSHKEIVDQLFLQGAIIEEQVAAFIGTESVSQSENIAEQATSGDMAQATTTATGSATDDVQFLVQKLYRENPQSIIWLQNVLLECCFIKFRIAEGVRSNHDLFYGNGGQPGIMEPIPLIYILKKQSVPLIPWTNDQFLASMNQPFNLLLHKLGFHLAVDARKLFARIPEFWTSDHLYSVASRLGPITKRFPPNTEAPGGDVVHTSSSSAPPSGARVTRCGDNSMSLLNTSEGYPEGDTSTTRRTSGFSGASTNLSISLLTNWMDSPSLGGAVKSKKAGTTDESNISGPTDSSTDAFLCKSLSLQSTSSSRKQSMDEDTCSAAAVLDEEELNQDEDLELGVEGVKGQKIILEEDFELEGNEGQSMATIGRKLLMPSPAIIPEAMDSISIWETASQVSSVPGMCVSDEETISYGNL